MLTALAPLPLVNIIGPRLADPGRLRVHSLWAGRPMPGSRGRESCMYIHLTSGNLMTSFSII